MMKCALCESINTYELKKKTQLGYRQYHCRDCRSQYNERSGTPYNFLHYPTDIVWLVVFYYYHFKNSLVDVTEHMALRGFSISQPGHLVKPRKALLRVIKLSGITHTIHDLRRTFITIAESLDIPIYALKRLLNHKMTGELTAGYIVADVERLRRPMQLITDYILKMLGEKEGAILLEFPAPAVDNVTL